MPALPPVPKVIKMIHRVAVGSDVNAVCIGHMQYAGTAPSSSDLDTFAAAVASHWNTRLAPNFTADRIYEECTCIDLTSSTSATGSVTVSHPGTRTDVALPAEVALIIQRKIGRRYRGGHSRQYWPAGGDTSVTTPQTWDPTFLAQFETNYFNWISDYQGAPWTGATLGPEVNVSYYEGFTNFLYPSGRYRARPTPRVTPLIDGVFAFTGNPKFGSQRRRVGQSA